MRTVDELMRAQQGGRFQPVVRLDDPAARFDEGTYAIGRDDSGGWVTFAVSRDGRSDEKHHASEADAVRELEPLVRLMADPPTAAPLSPGAEEDARADQRQRLAVTVSTRLADELAREGRAGQVPVALALPGQPAPSEDVWVAVVSGDGSIAVGAVGRGSFAPYADLLLESEVGALVERLQRAAPVMGGSIAEKDLLAGGAATGDGIRGRVGSGGGPVPCAVPAGSLLDVIGSDRQHHLYAAGTPLPARSQPPSDVHGEYHAYRVVRPLSGREGVAAPWFGQPGGGAMVVLDRPIRWYVDEGALVEVQVDTGR